MSDANAVRRSGRNFGLSHLRYTVGGSGPSGGGMGAPERRGGSMPDGPFAMMIAHFKMRFRERVSEWMCAYIMLWCGLIFLEPSVTFKTPTYIPLARIASEDAWGWLCLIVGSARIIVLLINGLWLPSYRLRSALAVPSIIFWTQLSLGAIFFNSQGIGAAIFPALLIGDLYAVYKALVDYRLASALEEASSASRPRADSQ